MLQFALIALAIQPRQQVPTAYLNSHLKHTHINTHTHTHTHTRLPSLRSPCVSFFHSIFCDFSCTHSFSSPSLRLSQRELCVCVCVVVPCHACTLVSSVFVFVFVLLSHVMPVL